MDGDSILRGGREIPCLAMSVVLKKIKAQQPWSPPYEGDGAWACGACRLRLRAWKKGATVEGPRAIQYRIMRLCANGMAEGGGADMHVPLWADWHAVL